MGMVRHTAFAAIMIAVIALGQAKAQEVLLPLQTAPVSHRIHKSASEAVRLPFFDDFSYSTTMPLPSLWEAGGATVGTGYGELPPTVGMATLDAIDANGELYPQASTALFPADTLMSVAIRLDSLSPADSVVLSFFYLPGGGSGDLWRRVGDAPDPSDSLFLEFYRAADSSWVTVWSHEGVSVDTLIAHTGKAWQYVALTLDDSAWFDSTFRFRFRNLCSLDGTSKRGMKGNCDQWNIDYLLLDSGRSMAAEPHWHDVAFVRPAPSMLARYQAMPARQYRSSDMAQQLSMTITNLYSSELASHYSYFILDSLGDTLYTYDGGFENAPVNGYQSAAAHATPPVGYAFPENITPCEYRMVHTVREGVGGDSHSQNDTVSFVQRFADYYAYDDGTPENGYGLTSTASHVYLAYRFDLNQPDTISAVDLYFNRTLDGENEDILFKITVWQAGDDGRPGTVLYSDSERRRPEFDGLNSYHTYILDEPKVVGGSLFVGFDQTGNDFINLGFDRNTSSEDRIWYLTSTEWQQSILCGSLMIRPRFGMEAATGIGQVPGVATMNVYPNPANDILHIDNIPVGSSLTLYDIQGRKVLSSQRSSLDTRHCPQGVYLLRVVAPDGTMSHHKIIIRH